MAKFLVIGAGGIGGIVTASLGGAQHDVVCSTTNAEIFEAVRRDGFRLLEAERESVVRARIVSGMPNGETFDYVLLATQPPQVEEAARAALTALAPEGRLVCFQNGLCEERIAKFAGRERVIGAVVAWGAAMPKPGVYDKTADGGFTLGYLDGHTDSQLLDLAQALESVGSVDVTDNLAGKRWSKLAINCAISSLGTIGGGRLGELMTHRFARRLALEVMTEAVEVARAQRVRLEKVSGTIDLEWIALTDAEKTAAGSAGLLAKHSLLLGVGFRYRRMRSSMLSAIERGRPPAVDFLNGEIVARAREHGVSAKVNAAVQDTVWRLARNEGTPSVDALKTLFDATGPH
jgi:2-dehydropantoate 2-reductase